MIGKKAEYEHQRFKKAYLIYFQRVKFIIEKNMTCTPAILPDQCSTYDGILMKKKRFVLQEQVKKGVVLNLFIFHYFKIITDIPSSTILRMYNFDMSRLLES